MNWKEELAKLEALLAEGKTDELFEAAKPLMAKTRSSISAPKERAEVVALIGMARYRRKEFDKARKCFDEALVRDSKNERAAYGMAYLAAYVDKDSDKVREWMEKLPESAARDNAWMVVMRSPEYIEANGLNQTTQEVAEVLIRRMIQNPEDPLNTANILHNAARFYMIFAEEEVSEEKLLVADKNISLQMNCSVILSLLEGAIGLYGTGDMNLHHRAAAHYWLSAAQEKLFGPAAAIPFACESARLWYEQFLLDQDNPHYLNSLNGSRERLVELCEKLESMPTSAYLNSLISAARDRFSITKV